MQEAKRQLKMEDKGKAETLKPAGKSKAKTIAVGTAQAKGKAKAKAAATARSPSARNTSPDAPAIGSGVVFQDARGEERGGERIRERE